ncbi:hypothetical protein BV25DRAFT_1768956, partial [Artomyces pyxidatus]
LHPRYKKTYFLSHDWSKEWVDEAIDLITTHWKKWYKPRLDEAPTEATPPPTGGRFSAIDTFGRNSSAPDEDELEQYLRSPPLPGVTDPLKYWAHYGESHLATMAINFLSAPG